MKAQFKILSGARAGQVEVQSRGEIQIGRHPGCDLRFHPDQDLDVSTHHAVVRRAGNTWLLRDLGSRNGTLLNGHRINAETRIDDTDQIRLGGEGPLIEFRLVPDNVPDTPPATFAHAEMRPSTAGPASAPPAPVPSPAPAARTGRTTERIRIEVAKQTQNLRWVSAALLAVLAIALAGFYAINTRQERQRQAAAAAMQTRVDSVMRAADDAVRRLQGEVTGLADALRQSQTQVQQLQGRLASAQASGDRGQVAAISRQLAQASTLLRNQQLAAQVDYRGINAANEKSIALIYVKFGPKEVFTGTAFAVRDDGIMLTNRHVVAGEDGSRQALDVALKFADSYQVFKGRILAISKEADVAVVKVENLAGTVPTVRGLNARADTVQAGDPVAMIGFPLGLDLPMGGKGEKMVAKTTFAAGTVSKVLPDRIQIDGYSAQGASGSPIFDRNGEVIAVLYGGQPGTNGRVVFGVPAGYAARLLQTVN